MVDLTVELPEAVHADLQNLAAARHLSPEALRVEMANVLIEQAKAERHFRERAARGNPERGLGLLEKIAQRSRELPQNLKQSD